MTATPDGLAYVEAEREHFAQVAVVTLAELKVITAERDAALARLADLA